MKYFDRVCAVDISPDIRVEKLRIRFEIKKVLQLIQIIVEWIFTIYPKQQEIE